MLEYIYKFDKYKVNVYKHVQIIFGWIYWYRFICPSVIIGLLDCAITVDHMINTSQFHYKLCESVLFWDEYENANLPTC